MMEAIYGRKLYLSLRVFQSILVEEQDNRLQATGGRHGSRSRKPRKQSGSRK